MQYISPIHTLGLDGVTTLEKSALSMAKKKLLAEIELSPTATILRGDKELTKDDVLKAFDNIAQIADWDKHLVIAQDVTLLAFLEKNELSQKSIFLKQSEYNSEDFIDFISPYFLTSYRKVLFNCLKNRDVLLLKKLINETPKLFTDWGKEEIDGAVNSWIEGCTSEVDEAAAQVESGEYISKKEIDVLAGDKLIYCLNALGSDFEWQRDNMAEALFNLSTNLWNRFLRNRARKVLFQAQKLKCSQYTVSMLKERDDFFKEHDSGNWIIFYWRAYNMTYFQKRPRGLWLFLAWIPKIIAAPVVWAWKVWGVATSYFNKYVVGQAVEAIGNYIVAIGTLIYSVWLVIGTVGLFIWFFSSNNTDSVSNNTHLQGLHDDVPIVVVSIDDSIKTYQELLEESKKNYEKQAKYLSRLDTFIERKDLYETTFAQFLLMKQRLKELTTDVKLSSSETEKQQRKQLLKNVKDSVKIFEKALDNVVFYNAYIRDLGYELKAKDPNKYENIDWDTLKDTAQRKAVKASRDSIIHYDEVLKKLLKKE